MTEEEPTSYFPHGISSNPEPEETDDDRTYSGHLTSIEEKEVIKNLRRDLEKNNKACSELNSKLKIKDNECEEKDAIITKLNNNLSQSQTENARIKEEIEKLSQSQTENTKIKEEIEKLSQSKTENAKIKEELKKSLSTYKDEILDKNKHIQQLEEDIQKLRNNLCEAPKTNTVNLNEENVTIQELNDRITKLETENLEKDNQLLDKEERLNQLQSEQDNGYNYKFHENPTDVQRLEFQLEQLNVTSIKDFSKEEKFQQALEDAVALANTLEKQHNEIRVNANKEKDFLSELKVKLEKTPKQCDDYSNRIQSLRDQLQTKNLALTLEKNKQEILGDQGVAISNTEEILRNEKKELLRRIQEVTQQKDQAILDVKYLKGLVNSNKSKYENSEENYEHLKKSTDEQIGALQDQIALLQVERDSASEEVSSLKTQIDVFKNQLKEKNSAEESSKTASQKEVNSLTNQIGRLQEELNANKLKLQDASYELIMKEKEKSELQKSFEAKEAKLSDDINKLTRDFSVVKENLSGKQLAYDKQKEAAEEEIQRQTVKCKDLEAKHLDLNEKLITIEESKKNLASELHDKSVLLQRGKDELDAKNRELEAKAQEITALKSEHKRQRENDDENLLELQSKIEDGQKEVETTRKMHHDVLQRYNKLAIDAKVMEEAKEHQIQQLKQNHLDDMNRLKIKARDDIDSLTAQLIAAEEAVQSDRAKTTKDRATMGQLQNAHAQIERVRREYEDRIAILDNQSKIYQQDFETERADRMREHEKAVELREENARLKERLDEISAHNLENIRQRHGSNINLTNLVQVDPQFHVRATAPIPGLNLDLRPDEPMRYPHGAVGGVEPNAPNNQPESLQVQEFICPVCQDVYPDEESIQNHVNDCLK